MYSNAGTRVLALFFALTIWNASGYPSVQKEQQKHETKADSTEDQVYEIGGDVRSPKLLHYVEPAFSPKSKEAYVEGTVRISTVVNKSGSAVNPQVLSGLNAEEDRTAIEALKQWKFEPGTRSGEPVNVRVTVEINFHLL